MYDLHENIPKGLLILRTPYRLDFEKKKTGDSAIILPERTIIHAYPYTNYQDHKFIFKKKKTKCSNNKLRRKQVREKHDSQCHHTPIPLNTNIT